MPKKELTREAKTDLLRFAHGLETAIERYPVTLGGQPDILRHVRTARDLALWRGYGRQDEPEYDRNGNLQL